MKEPLPLAELSRDELSVFIYVALVPDETAAVVKELGIVMPGFRNQKLGDVERCDLLADEIRAGAGDALEAVTKKLAEAYERAPLPEAKLDKEAALDLLDVGSADDGLVLALWRVLADESAEVRAQAKPLLQGLAKEYYGAPGSKPAPAKKKERDSADVLAEKVKALEAKLAEEREKVEQARKKGEGEREKLKGELKAARAEKAKADADAAKLRAAAEAAQRERERLEQELQAAKKSDAASEARAARAQAKELEAKLGSIESRLEKARAREEELEKQLAAAQKERAAAPVPAAPTGEEGPEESAEGAAQFLLPVYTKEFYDSLGGWDRRIQRAAFKQANLLAMDHRHPSLRAIALEGLPGYYRVRVATDVRLLYRRGERQNTVEILSLIDREDLDRYIKQAKTRAG